MKIIKCYVCEDKQYGLSVGDIITFLQQVRDRLGDSKTEVVLGIKDSEQGDYKYSGFSEVLSWRGSYDEPCLIKGDNHNIETLLLQLEESVEGKVFYGYKGGEYCFHESQYLNVEPSYEAYTGEGYIRKMVFFPEKNKVSLFCVKNYV